MRTPVATRGVLTLAALYAAPVALWLASVPLDERFSDASRALTTAGVACGLAGATAYAANLLLGARLRSVTAFFGGLERMYALHRRNGRVAFVLVASHVLLVVGGRAATSASSALGLFTPSAGWTVWAGIVAFAGMAVALALTLYARLGHEVFVYVQRSFGVFFAVAAYHVFTTPGAKSTSRALTIFLAVVAAAALAAWGHRSVLGNLLVRRRDYRVSSVRELDPSVVEIAMTPQDGPLRFTPGQFVFVTFYSDEFDARFHPVSVASQGSTALVTLRPGDARDQYHPFSITSAPGDEHLGIAVKAVGDFTAALHYLRAGAWARIEGPYGDFSHTKVPNRRQVWVAGGIGITPFLSMARSLDGSYDVDLYYGAKTRAEAYFLDDLTELAERIGGLRVIPAPEDEVGFVTADWIERDSGLDADVLICGPPAMIESLRAQLTAKGVPESRIHFERFGFA